MKPETRVDDGGEVAGTKFFTWAIIVVTAGLLVAISTEFTSMAAPDAQQTVVRTAAPQTAS